MEKSTSMSGGEALLELFKIQGVDFIFCSPLSVWAPLWEALAKQKEIGKTETPRYINCRHEILAVGLASGYYKATGRPQVVLLPTGLGVLNGSMAIRGAYQERVPMVVLAPDSVGFGENPEFDPGAEWPSLLGDLGGPVRISESFVKWAKEVKNPRDLISDFCRACYFSEMVPRGPSLLSIPFDILMDTVPFTLPSKLKAHPLVAPADTLKEIARILVQSENPIIISEHACRTREEVNILTKLAELLGTPVFEFFLPTYKNFSRNHPLHGKGPVEEILKDADCVLVAGSNAPWHPPLIDFQRDCNVIVMEEDPLRPRAPYWGYKTDYCVAGDLGSNLIELYRHAKNEINNAPQILKKIEQQSKRWKTYNDKKRKSWLKETEQAQTEETIHASWLFRTLSELLPNGTIIVDEIIAQGNLMMQHLFQNESFSHYRGMAGGLGTGIPTALGIKLAEPEKLVVCLIGDGSFSYDPIPASLGLSQQYNLPILIIICNNQGFVSQSWNIQKYFPQGSTLKTGNFLGDVIEPTPDYSKIALAFDGYGERVEDPGKLKSAVERGVAAVKNGQLALVDIILKP